MIYFIGLTKRCFKFNYYRCPNRIRASTLKGGKINYTITFVILFLSSYEVNRMAGNTPKNTIKGLEIYNTVKSFICLFMNKIGLVINGGF
ncbi:hypothetical protein JM83_1698 [Gillisia sp. Hel_I_86]|nr:hypothetical protein JM83_1698 [Gillisia sp. Hel_I_86]